MKIQLNNVKVIRIKDVQTFQGTDFVKRSLIIEEGSKNKYPNEIEVEFKNSLTAMLDKFGEGDLVNVEAWLNGKSWLKEGQPESNRRWFLSLDAINIELVNSSKDEQMKDLAIADREALDNDPDKELPF